MPEPVVVFVSHSDIEASVVRGLLDAHGIHALQDASVSSSMLPLTRDARGSVKVSVRAEDADAARRLLADYRDPAPESQAVSLKDEFEAISIVLGHRFKDSGVLEQALTHRSRANEDVTGGVFDNESLEFLGDAVLGFVVADMLFVRFPQHDEGQKSKIKASLVSTATLARLADALHLGDHVLLGRGEEKTGGRRKQTLLADTFEAVIAALYLDGGIDAARAFIVREFEGLMMRTAEAGGMSDDHKSALQELLQSRGQPLPEYVVVQEDGPAHRRVFRIELRVRGAVIASAEGRTKKDAEQEAARLSRLTLSAAP
jgi:ribonuclease-3